MSNTEASPPANYSVARGPLTVKEAARALGISESLTRDLINGGQLPAYKYGQRKTLVYPEDLDAFKESRRVGPPGTKEAG